MHLAEKIEGSVAHSYFGAPRRFDHILCSRRSSEDLYNPTLDLKWGSWPLLDLFVSKALIVVF